MLHDSICMSQIAMHDASHSRADVSNENLLPSTCVPSAVWNESLFSPRFRRLTIGMMMLVALDAFEALAVATAMPAVAESLHGLPLYALAFASTQAASVIGMITAGTLCDARGPKPSLWGGVGLFAAGLLIDGFAEDMLTLLCGRVVQGLGSGLMSVTLYVTVAQTYPRALQPRIFAAFSAAWVIPSLIGPTLSGVIVQQLGWRWVFLMVPLFAVPSAVLMHPELDKFRPPSRNRDNYGGLPWRRIIWALIAMTSVCLLHIAGPAHEVGDVAVFALAATGLVFSARNLLPAGTLSAQRGLPSVIALRAIVGATFFGAEVFIPLMLSRRYGLQPIYAGLALTVAAVGWSAASCYQGHTQRSWTRTRMLQLGMFLMVMSNLLLALTSMLFDESTAYRMVIVSTVISWSFAGLGMGLISPSLSVLTLALSSASEQGQNSSSLRLADALGIATTLAIGGVLFDLFQHRTPTLIYAAWFGITGVLALLGLVLASRPEAP